jgi:hypothetical protein
MGAQRCLVSAVYGQPHSVEDGLDDVVVLLGGHAIVDVSCWSQVPVDALYRRHAYAGRRCVRNSRSALVNVIADIAAMPLFESTRQGQRCCMHRYR